MYIVQFAEGYTHEDIKMYLLVSKKIDFILFGVSVTNASIGSSSSPNDFAQ